MKPRDGEGSDGLASWGIGIASIREVVIRNGSMAPAASEPREARWAEEGWTKGKARKLASGQPDTRTLDTVRSRA